MRELLSKIFKTFTLYETFPLKHTARCCQTIICKSDSKLWRVIIGKTDIQKFYLNRAIRKQKDFFKDFSKYFEFIFPTQYASINDFDYVVYPYINHLEYSQNREPLDLLKKIHKNYALSCEIDKNLLKKIEEDFLSAWPEKYREKIKSLPQFEQYLNELKYTKEIALYKSHGDFTVNNILTNGKKYYLIDFEFARDFQPTLLDEGDYLSSISISDSSYKSKISKLYFYFQQISDAANYLLDSDYSSDAEIPISLLENPTNNLVTKEPKNMFSYIHKIFSSPSFPQKKQKSSLYPTELKFNSQDRILILSPHPDDESIGCGGLLLKYGKQCDVICLTDGRYGDPDIEPSKMAKIRFKEFQNVMLHLKVNNFVNLGIEDSHLAENYEKFSTINFANGGGYNYIFMPGSNDSHPDHMSVYNHFLRFCKTHKKPSSKIMFYEIWSALSAPTSFINISDIIQEKKNLINMYKSQVKFINYAEKILGLNIYRSITTTDRLNAIECYQEVLD